MTIIFDTEAVPAADAYRELIEYAADGALAHLGFDRDCELSVTLTDDAHIHEFNREYRGVDRATDVLSFPMYSFSDGDVPPEDGDFTLGDVVISVERAEAQAKEYGHSTRREIAFLTVHSILHLLGWDHETSPEDERAMFAKQDEIMTALGIERENQNNGDTK